MRIFMTAIAVFVFCLAGFAQETGPVSIGGVTYDSVDPGPAFTPAATPVQDWRTPTPTSEETTAGMLAYVTADPGDYKPERLPKVSEHATRLSAALTPGEDEALWFGIQALTALKGLEISVSLPNSGLTVDVRHEHFWPQRTGWASRQWYMTPELLLPCNNGMKTVPLKCGELGQQAFDVAKGQTAAFWLTVTAAPNARPGVYRGAVTLSSDSGPSLVLPLRVQVYPFTLQRPADHWWLLYADIARFNTMSDTQIIKEFKEFARHGITGLVEIPLGSVDLSGIKEGKVKFDASNYCRITALARKAGINGPHVVAAGGFPEQVAKALGYEGNLHQGDWPQEVKDGLTLVAKAALTATAKEPSKWYFYGVDEPAGDNTYAIQDYLCWHNAGVPTYATFYMMSFLEKASEYLTAPCFVAPLISNPDTSKMAVDICKKTGAEFWWYGTGSYVNAFPQEGFMYHNRYGSGFLFYKTGAKAEVAWTFCRPHEDVFNDFDGSKENGAEPKEQATAYPHLLKANDWTTYQGIIPTIAWESIREGVDDYLYIYTLQQAIAKGIDSDNPAVRDLAGKCAEKLDAITADIPWANPLGEQIFSSRKITAARKQIARMIIYLQNARK